MPFLLFFVLDQRSGHGWRTPRPGSVDARQTGAVCPPCHVTLSLSSFINALPLRLPFCRLVSRWGVRAWVFGIILCWAETGSVILFGFFSCCNGQAVFRFPKFSGVHHRHVSFYLVFFYKADKRAHEVNGLRCVCYRNEINGGLGCFCVWYC